MMKLRHTCASILLMAAGMLVFTGAAVQAQVNPHLTKSGKTKGPRHPNPNLPQDREAYHGKHHKPHGPPGSRGLMKDNESSTGGGGR